jgi:AraC family transcriptional regulator of adaptative response/methylated-DNA-[protein]-cysteine methyltransferase
MTSLLEQRTTVGMTSEVFPRPSVWHDGGDGVTIEWTVANTALGLMLLAATDIGVCRLSFDEDETMLRQLFPKADIVVGGASTIAWANAAALTISNPAYTADIPLDVGGTTFQMAVWQALLRIPVGETRNYAQIAAAVGRPDAVRAAGAANGANPVAVLIPCHRVIRSDGGLGGYAYGLERKRRLLAKEIGQGTLFSV